MTHGFQVVQVLALHTVKVNCFCSIRLLTNAKDLQLIALTASLMTPCVEIQLKKTPFSESHDVTRSLVIVLSMKHSEVEMKRIFQATGNNPQRRRRRHIWQSLREINANREVVIFIDFDFL